MANLSLEVRIHVASVLALSPRRVNGYRCQLLSRTILNLDCELALRAQMGGSRWAPLMITLRCLWGLTHDNKTWK